MLTQRQLLIFNEIVRHFSETGQPVGSKTLMANLPIKVSSATIRNEMAVLESEGLLEKTHLSSGRIPSMRGYRFYLDHLIKPTQTDATEITEMQTMFNQASYRLDEIIAQSATILSTLTSYTAIALGPEVKSVRLTGFRLVSLNNHQVMAIIVTSSGSVENQIFNLPGNVVGEDLERIVRWINDKLVGLPLTEVIKRLHDETPILLTQYVQTPTGFLDIFGDVLSKVLQERYYVGGKMNLLNYSTADNLDQLKSIYSMIDKTDAITDLLGTPNEHITVRLGGEMTNDLLKDFSLITASYDVGEHGRGVVALLGPTAMPYSKMIGLVDVFRSELIKRLADYYKHFDD